MRVAGSGVGYGVMVAQVDRGVAVPRRVLKRR